MSVEKAAAARAVPPRKRGKREGVRGAGAAGLGGLGIAAAAEAPGRRRECQLAALQPVMERPRGHGHVDDSRAISARVRAKPSTARAAGRRAAAWRHGLRASSDSDRTIRGAPFPRPTPQRRQVQFPETRLQG